MEEQVGQEKWEIVSRQSILEHPFVTVSMEKVRLPDGRIIEDWPKIYTRDYINAVVINEAGEALIMTGYKHGIGRSNWQVVAGYMEDGEDPLTAVKRELREETGFACDDWHFLGSYAVDSNRHIAMGHFFCGVGAKQVASQENDDLEHYSVQWVSLDELKTALQDGRIATGSYALAVSLSLLTVLKREHFPQILFKVG